MTSAREFTARLGALLRRERGAMAEFLLALADFDRRRIWVELGYPSLFSFLRRELGLSAGAAQLRKTAAELLQKLPGIEAPIRDGRLCLSTVCALADVLTAENQDEVLPRFFGLSKREAEGLAAAIQPAAATHREVVTVVRAAASPAALRSLAAGTLTPSRGDAGAPAEALGVAVPHGPFAPASSSLPAAEASSWSGRAPPPALPSPTLVFHPGEAAAPSAGPGSDAGAKRLPEPPPPSPELPPHLRRSSAEPLTADLRRLHLTVSQRVLDKLEAARSALSHARPGASAAEVIEVALDLLLETRARKKGIVKNPRAKPRPARPNRVSAHVKRSVWTRDGGRCQWPLDAGGVCGSTLRVEVDHVEPRARGGPPTAENLRLLCAFHNQLAARQAFGEAWMDRYARRRPRDRGPPGRRRPAAGPEEA